MRQHLAFFAGWIAIASIAAPATARIVSYDAELGSTAPTKTGSLATGKATVVVDTERNRVSVDLAIAGLTMDSLADALLARPIGPIHFHKYGSHDHSGDDVVLVLPLPFGPGYTATDNGFHVVMRDYDYATGAKLLGSPESIDSFVAAMDAGQVILNVHTDKFPEGEISGTVRPH